MKWSKPCVVACREDVTIARNCDPVLIKIEEVMPIEPSD